MPSKLLCPISFLLPLCHSGARANVLEKVGVNPIFDRNIVGVVAQFAVILESYFRELTLFFFLS